jgi:hypothetical protein
MYSQSTSVINSVTSDGSSTRAIAPRAGKTPLSSQSRPASNPVQLIITVPPSPSTSFKTSDKVLFLVHAGISFPILIFTPRSSASFNKAVKKLKDMGFD